MSSTAAIRISTYSPSPKARRLELRFPDPSCNPYIAFTAMMFEAIEVINKLSAHMEKSSAMTMGSKMSITTASAVALPVVP